MKTFAIFATLLSMAFAKQELLDCMDPAAVTDQQTLVANCQEVTDSTTKLGCDSTHDQIINSAKTGHVHEVCILNEFGWISDTGDVQMDNMIADLTGGLLKGEASADLKAAMEDPNSGFAVCLPAMEEKEEEKAKAQHDKYLADCHGEEPPFTQDEIDAQKELHGNMGKQNAAAHCVMAEMMKACGVPPPAKKSPPPGQ